MDKSQLRRLALDFARGNLDAAEYQRQRDELIDGIVGGTVDIVREPALEVESTQPGSFTPAAPAAAAAPRAVPGRPSAASSLSPLHLGIGAGALVLVIAAVLSLGGEDEPVPPATKTLAAPLPAPAPAIPMARELVERFVAEKNFSTASLARFRDAWRALEPTEVDTARGTPWFRRMVTAVVQEVKTQKALADLDGTGAALESARRVADFGRFLGVSESMLPTVDPPAVAASTPPTLPSLPEAEGPTAAADVEAPANVPIGDSRVSTPIAAEPPAPVATQAAAPAPPEPQGRAWLSRQPADAYTLQLFALNHLDKVESLMQRHPQLPLQLVDYAPAEPRYRVFLGRFLTPDGAREAYAALPEDVRRDQPKAFVRTIGELREPDDTPSTTSANATMTTTARARETPPEALAPGWLQAQAAGGFTLQLFATNSVENAKRLIARFPNLALVLHESADALTRFRVLYGSFASAEEARAAFTRLPQGLAESAGLPLVKPIGELQQSAVQTQ